MHTLTIHLSDEMNTVLQAEATRLGKPVPQMVQEHLSEWLRLPVPTVPQTSADVELSLAQQQMQPSTTREERIQRIRALQQTYGHVLSSSDEFARRKQEEIDREER